MTDGYQVDLEALRAAADGIARTVGQVSAPRPRSDAPLMVELGETTDPRLLVPGAAEAARAVARSMGAYAGNLSQAGDGLAFSSTPGGWSGEAADAFRSRFATQPPAWQDVGGAFTGASRALDVMCPMSRTR